MSVTEEIKHLKLGDITSLSQGLAINSKTKHLLKNKGIPLLRIKDLINNQVEQYIDTENAPGKCLASKSDIIYTRTGQVGLVFNDREGVIHNNCFKVIPDETIVNKKFLYWFLFQKKVRDYAINIASGSVQKDLNHSSFASIPIKLPSLKHQEKAAKIFDKLKRKIELNQKMNETLEEIAKTLFKSWFIDFDPVRAKAEGRPTGLSKEISDLFPDSFEDSELGQIPEGFKVDSVDNQYDISIGKTPPRKEPQWFSDKQQDIPWASIKDMGDAGVYINKTSEFLTNEAIEKFNIHVIPKNNVILSFKLTVGRVAILQKDMCTNEAIAHFVPKDNDLSNVFTYCLLKSIRYESLSSTSSIATAVNSKIIKAMKCIFPSKALLIAFNEFCRPIYKKIETNTNEIETLLSLRDTLLPKLISRY